MKVKMILLFLIISTSFVNADIYPDQMFAFKANEHLMDYVVESHNISLNSSNNGIELLKQTESGFIIFQESKSQFPFNEGLPSWNGSVPDDKTTGFKVQMRFKQHLQWSPWVTVGYWKNNVFQSYGETKWADGKVNIDVIKLETYSSSWQFKIQMKRGNIESPSPVVNSLNFVVSDSETTDNFDIKAVLKDKPEAIFIDTVFINQYKLDKKIGGSICSPTIVSMILNSYNRVIDPLEFAKDTKDPYWGIYGVWPRAVQNASEFGLEGVVTRFRNWSQVREVLANGGRIGISVGRPLYKGHLMMIAGFDEDGNPIVHDPAKDDGYSYKFDKEELSKAWFNKGGIAYTFYQKI